MRKGTLSSLRSAAWFLVKLNVLAVPLYLAVYAGYSVPELQHIWAAALDQSLTSLGYETALQDEVVAVTDGSVVRQIEVSWDSTGWKSMYAMAALTLASGVSTLRGRLRFLAFGLPLVAFVNMLRLTTTVGASLELGFAHFDFVHTFLWGGLMIVLVVAVWYFGLLRQVKS